MMYHKHGYCENFVIVDAVKGRCLLSGALVQFDDAACPQYEAAPHCFCCANYSGAADGLGSCNWNEGAWVFATLRARNCAGHKKGVAE